jgi:Sec-independent protein translocase protein TatA
VLALIGNLDSMEVVVVLIAAILIFGRRLPQVAAQAGAQLGKLRRTLDTAWKDSGADHEVREMQRSIESIRDAVPRDLSAGSVARLAANEFQRRVERKHATEEGLAAGATALVAGTETNTALDASAAPAVNARPDTVRHEPAATVPRGAPAHEDVDASAAPAATPSPAPSQTSGHAPSHASGHAPGHAPGEALPPSEPDHARDAGSPSH